MNADQRLLVVGLYINSALYLAGVYCAGLINHNPWAWKGALAASGVSYLAYLSQISVAPRPVQIVCVIASILLGAGAGISLLV